MRIVAQRKVNTKAFSAQSTDASSRRNVEECAAITTPEQNGFPDQDRHHAPRQSDWSIVASGATALMERTSTDCSGSRAVSAPYAGLMGVLDDLSIGSQISFSTITTKQGSHAAFYATTATELQDELEVPRFWNAPSTTSEIATDVVESVTPFGRERVYDLTVAGTHNFIANGLWTHNTRWHEDDIIGRLTDRHNPYYVADEAAAWQIISLPAIAGLNDLLGRAEGEALWPERFGVDYLDVQRRSDPRGFQALYQGNPTPIDGSFFKSNHFRTYQKMSDLPPIDSLRFYVVSDHAVATAQHNDKTCMIPIGIDGHNHVWVLPDIFWNRSPTDAVVEAMLLMMEKYKPQYWWAEKGHITKSIGPFLRKRMLEKHIYCAIDEIQPAVDKTQRAQAIQARMAMGMVHFPAFARWWSDAQDQMLKFPNGTFDDFVDALSMVGLGLAKQAPRGNNRKVDAGPRPLTLGWIKQQSKNQQREDWIKADLRGW
jgi:predicted phage terminase large subunit-like protein